jgi:hypothetical protein
MAQNNHHHNHQRRRRGNAMMTSANPAPLPLLLLIALVASAGIIAARAAQPDPLPASRFADVPVPRLTASSSRPRAAFTSSVNHAAATSASVLIPVTLDASGSAGASGGGIQKYEWTVLRWREDQDVGASVRRLTGQTATVELAPNYTYSVDLAVTDGAGEKGYATGPVWVPPQEASVASAAAPPVGPAPKVVISSPAPLQPTSAADGGRVALDGSKSKPGTSGAAITSYAWRAWRLTDGEPVPVSAGSAARGAAALPGGQAYTLELTVRDAKGNVGVGSAEVYVGKPGKPIPATTSATGA